MSNTGKWTRDQMAARVARVIPEGAVVNLGMDKKMWLSWLALGRPLVVAVRAHEAFVEPGPDSPRLGNYDPGDKLINHAAEHSPLRHANNLESVLTYEGTSEIHQLVLGQQLTGISAFS